MGVRLTDLYQLRMLGACMREDRQGPVTAVRSLRAVNPIAEGGS